MGWFSLLSAVFQFGAQLFKYLRAKEEADNECAVKVKEATDVIKEAQKTKDTSKLERLFSDLK
jgi:hypothetical protein